MTSRKSRILASIDRESKILEIGPLDNPIAPRHEGWNCFTIDHANTAEIKEKYRNDPNVNCDNIVDIDFVTGVHSFIEHIPRQHIGTFDVCIASHVLEHVPDTIRFINSIMELLCEDGILICILPDKNKCFDIFKPLTITSDVLDAYREQRSIHSRKTRWDQCAYSVLSGSAPAWVVEPERPLTFVNPSLDDAHQSYLSDTADYSDCHTIYCTPHSFELILLELNALRYINVNILHISDTIGIEFDVKLKKGSTNYREDITSRRLKLLQEGYGAKNVGMNRQALDTHSIGARRSAHVDGLTTEQDTLALRVDALSTLVDSVTAERDSLASRVHALEASTSWRLTRPARIAARVWNAIRQGSVYSGVRPL